MHDRISRRTRRGRRTYASRLGIMLAAVAAVALALGAGAAGAGGGSQRVPLPFEAFDVPEEVCGFPIHVEAAMANEYAKVTENPDGSTTYKIAGALKVTLTNEASGESITVNASGPGMATYSADGTVVVINAQGLNLFYALNAEEFGLPNYMLTAGPFQVTLDLETASFVTVERQPNVLMDVCAELS